MAALDRFVLPEDVVIAPIADLPDEIRGKFSHEEGDLAVTRPRSRGNSTVVDFRSAGLLERFRTPSTIVEAVIAYSTAEGLDPRETLDGAFGMLSGCVADGLLLSADSALAQAIVTSLPPGARVGSFEVIEPVHVIIDSEVYLAAASDGSPVAIKIVRVGAGGQVAAAFRHEAEVLARLDGCVSPRLLEAGIHEERDFLAVSWHPGVDALQAAGEARGLGPAAGRDALLALAEAVIAAYAQLHGQHVAHGDVHPRNVLVEGDGVVRLIDFGLAVQPAPVGAAGGGWRGGIDFFLEPEAAAARLAGRPAPALSLAAEQYSIAALLYLMLTGEHTQDFSLEPEEMLRQLVESPALPFESHGVAGMEAVEAVLRKALAKDPADRYESTEELQWAFRLAAEEDRGRRIEPPPRFRPGSAALLDEVLERLAAPDGELFAQGIPAPTASAMNGGAGFAYALLRIAAVREDESLLALADLWAVRSRLAMSSEEAFWSTELEIVPEVFGENSFYHHRAGVEAVLALVAAARGDEWAARQALEGFVAAAEAPCQHLDVAFGRAGLLLGASQLLEALPEELEAGPLRAAGDALRDSLWSELERQPALPESTALRSLGAAHGWAGYLFALLRWGEASETPLPVGVEPRLRELGAMASPAGRGLRWPYEAGSPVAGSGLEASWCNGAAGYVFLWAAAQRAFGEDPYARWARMAAWTAYESEAVSVGDLCCGFAGRAYALLCLHRSSGEESWLARARLLLEHAEAGIRSAPLRRDSLYKGEIGVALLAADLEQPEYAGMPLFEAEGWPRH